MRTFSLNVARFLTSNNKIVPKVAILTGQAAKGSRIEAKG